MVEEAITVWATVSGYLLDAWETYENEPEEIGTALADLHLQLCQTLQPDPLDLAARLAWPPLVTKADAHTYLDLPNGYADVVTVRNNSGRPAPGRPPPSCAAGRA